MNTIVLASKNSGKLKEFRSILKDVNVKVISSAEAGFNEEIEEDQKTLEGNSLKKASIVSKSLGLPAVADDTGIFIDALGGKPGVYSARWAGEGASDQDIIKHTLTHMTGVPLKDRNAKFKTVATFILPDGRSPQLFTGVNNGSIATEARGTLRPGMPYDCLFMPDGKNKTFAELTLSFKNQNSHRARAFMQLRDYLNNILRRP